MEKVEINLVAPGGFGVIALGRRFNTSKSFVSARTQKSAELTTA